MRGVGARGAATLTSVFFLRHHEPVERLACPGPIEWEEARATPKGGARGGERKSGRGERGREEGCMAEWRGEVRKSGVGRGMLYQRWSSSEGLHTLST